MTPGQANPTTVAPARWAWSLSDAMPPLAALPTAPACARGFVRMTLATWGMAGLADVAELVTSELVSNAVNATSRNAGYGDNTMSVVRVCLFADGVRVLVEVHDMGPGTPELRHVDADGENGRGLELVDALAARWGWQPSTGRLGKVVWAVMTF